MEDVYKYDELFKERYVLAGSCALARNGLIMLSPTHLCLQVEDPSMNHFRTCVFEFLSPGKVDYEYALTPSPRNSNLLLPSKERTLVECILHPDWVDEGFLIEGLQDYLWLFYQEERLEEARKHFGLSKETLNYWLEEARNDKEV